MIELFTKITTGGRSSGKKKWGTIKMYQHHGSLLVLLFFLNVLTILKHSLFPAIHIIDWYYPGYLGTTIIIRTDINL